VKNVLRISLCLFLFICVTRVKCHVAFKSRLCKIDLVASHQDHNPSGNDVVFAEDTDGDVEINHPDLQYAETFNDLRCSNFVAAINPGFNSRYSSYTSSRIIFYRTLRL
jgi:hypothetical protein